MKTGLVLEGGAMRGLYTAGVLDIFLDNNIKIDGIVGVSAGVLFGVNYPSKQRGRVLRYNKKYVKDKRFMSIHSFLTTGNIVNNPNLVNTINNRYINYNNCVEKIINMENKKEIFVIRPSKTIEMKRIERDANKLQEMYDLGVEDCKNNIDKLKQYLNEEL